MVERPHAHSADARQLRGRVAAAVKLAAPVDVATVMASGVVILKVPNHGVTSLLWQYAL